MKKIIYKAFLVLLILVFNLAMPGQAYANSTSIPKMLANSKVLTANNATAAHQSVIPVYEKRPMFTGYATSTLPGLSVSGINIVANGQTVRLHGVNMGDPFWARGWYGTTYSTNDYYKLSHDWQANVVRISIYPTQWKNMDRATLLAGLAQEVNAALNNGMYIIISYQVIGWPNGFYQSTCCGNPADTYDSSMNVATSFWTQMAQTYGSDTRIIFDLWNEPVHPDDFTLYGSTPNPLWPILKGFYESLIQTVRTNGAQNIVIATGNRWSSWLAGIKDSPLADSKVVYAYHKYSVNGSNTAVEWNKDTGGLIGIKPVIVSEWGYEDADVASPTWVGSQSSYGDPFTQWMNSNNLGNLAWMYHHDWTPALLKPDGGPTSYGAFAKQYISSQATTRFAVIGDYGQAGQPEADVAALVKSWNPEFIITTGDNNYSLGGASTIDANIGQYYHQYISPYSGVYGAGAVSNNFYPTLGNHDWLTKVAQLPKPYLDYFSLPGNERYYDFTRGPVHFFVVDSDASEPDGITSASVQGQWLQSALAASTAPWNVVYLHHAPYSSSIHGSNIALQWPFQTWGADIVLSGHDHTYERLSINGIPYIVNGLGGMQTIYSFNTPVAGSQLCYNADFGAMLVDATNTNIKFKFITRTGAIVDSFSLGTLPTASVTTGVFRPSNGLLYLKNANISGFADVSINYGTGGDYPITGDWDGNGTDTIGIYRNGSFYLRNSNTVGFADLVFAFGQAGDQPVAGDWNGDGIDTIGVYRNGIFFLRDSNSTGAPDTSFSLGNPGDVGIAGDWNGDHLDTTGVFRPSNGVIFLKNFNTSGFADVSLNYGLPGDQPVIGDWNGDGIDTIGVYRNAQFLLRNSNTVGFADLVFALGNPGDMPISGNWDGLP